MEEYLISQEEFQAAQDKRRPSVLFRPALYMDGDQWCALYGENLQEGVSGFGASPASAMLDFDSNWEDSSSHTAPDKPLELGELKRIVEELRAEEDNWRNSNSFICATCLYYVEKDSELDVGRCRRLAPTIKGYPVVYGTDWCGDHKLGVKNLKKWKDRKP